MVLPKEETKAKCQSGAKHCDLFARVYTLIGFSMDAYRLRAAELPRLKKGGFCC